MTSDQKDKMCDGMELQTKVNQFHQQQQSRTTLKRMATSEGHRFGSNDEDEQTYGQWEQPHSIKQRRGNEVNDRDDRHLTTVPRTFINSNHNNNQHRQVKPVHNHNNDNNNIDNNNHMKISKHALDYASEYHYTPFKIICEPKLKDTKQGSKLINELIKSIKTKFLYENPMFTKPLLFDLWWIDPAGDLQIIIKTTELYVFLCKQERYPKELIDIKLTPHPPSHLPPQHTAILKWINHTITKEDIKEELSSKYESIFSIEEMAGTINNRTRHVKVELLNKKEYNQLLNSGKISIFGHLYDVDEYLPAPKVLICSRCNQPGHTKKTCQNSNFDMCRRCGGDRSNVHEHKECPIKCHHCGEEHISTDYKCKIIDDYRRQLIFELKRHPERLPPDVQLFIPSGYRNQNDRSRTIYNKEAIESQQYIQQSQFNYRTDYNVWSRMKPNTTNSSTTDQELLNTIKVLSDELKDVKQRHLMEQQRIEQKFKSNMSIMNQAMMLIQQTQQTQQSMIFAMNDAINKTILSTCTKVTENLYSVVDKLKFHTNNTEFDDVLHHVSNQLLYVNEAHKEYRQHQEELKGISIKQNEALNMALDIFFKNHDV
jgi:hypothetical protein